MKLRRGGAAAVVQGPFLPPICSQCTSRRAGSSAARARAIAGPISLQESAWVSARQRETELPNGPPVPPTTAGRRGPQRERLDGDGQALALRDARGAPRPRREEVKGLVDGGGVALVAVAVSHYAGARAHAATISWTGRRGGRPGLSANKLGAAQFAFGAHPAARAAAPAVRKAAAECTAEGAAGAPLDGPFAAQPRLVTRYLYAVCLTL